MDALSLYDRQILYTLILCMTKKHTYNNIKFNDIFTYSLIIKYIIPILPREKDNHKYEDVMDDIDSLQLLGMCMYQ